MATGPEALKEEFLKETSPRKKQTNKNNLTNDNPNDYLNNSDQNISNSNYQSVKKTPPSNLPFG
jgi:hypothetical protein